VATPDAASAEPRSTVTTAVTPGNVVLSMRNTRTPFESVVSYPVPALSSPPTSPSQASNDFSTPWREPRNIKCSKKWASPARPGGSSFAPTW